MIPALVLLAAAQAEPGTDLIILSLRYLARHQAVDGSWGRRPAACRCPDEPPSPAAPGSAPARERAAALVPGLDDEDPERRLQAQAELVRLGAPAAEALRELADKGSPELRARVADVLRRLRAEGTASDVETTGWALLAFLGAGYSHLSKDEFDGLCFGAVVRRGLEWLKERQDARGAVAAPGSAAQAVAALALSEAYGLTASLHFKDGAQKAMDVVSASLAQEDRTLVWQVMALKSAEISEVEFPRDAYDVRLGELQRRRTRAPDDPFLWAGDTVARIFIRRSREGVDLGRMAETEPARVDFETAYLTSIALFQFDGPGGPTWKRFNEARKTWLGPLQATKRGACERGSWSAVGTAARLKVAAHGALMSEIYYAYGSVFK